MNTAIAHVVQPSLYEYEQDLLALLDTAEMVTPEQDAEFQRDLTEQLQKTVAKRDRVGSFIKHLEMQAKFAGEEIKRLQERKRLFEHVEVRLRGYVLHLIEELGPDAKGKLRKLEGERFTLSARACPVSLEITDEAAVPLEYKNVTVAMSAEDWDAFLEAYAKVYNVEFSLNGVSYSIDNAAVKAVLTGPAVPCTECDGIGMISSLQYGSRGAPEQCPVCHGACSVAPTVPGADLVVGKYSLQVK